MSTLDNIAIATIGYVCESAVNPVTRATHGYICPGVAPGVRRRGGGGHGARITEPVQVYEDQIGNDLRKLAIAAVMVIEDNDYG